MNVYDFDHTIYRGDSTVDFWRFCLRSHPRTLIALPKACLKGLLFALNHCSREEFKESFYQFLRFIPDASSEVAAFWNLHISKIAPWYLKKRQEDDLIISASPAFLLDPVCAKLGVRCIASKVNPSTGKLEGPNCRGEEKVPQFRQHYPNGSIDEFYSDSESDVFLAQMARKAFIVKRGSIKNWVK